MVSTSASGKHITLITGANQGIGLTTVQHLIQRSLSNIVLLGSRSLDNGHKAKSQLQKDKHLSDEQAQNIVPVQIDVTDQRSIDQAKQYIEQHYGQLDTLINNAGTGFGGSPGPQDKHGKAKQTIDVNYTGVKNVTNTLLPLIPKGGHVVVVSSQVGAWTLDKNPEPIKSQLLKLQGTTIADVDQLVDDYLETQKSGTDDTKKFAPTSVSYGAYGISKMFVTAWSQLKARELKDKQIAVAVICPGYTSTNMTNYAAPRTTDEAAESVLYGTTISLEQSGGFWQDGKKHPVAGRL